MATRGKDQLTLTGIYHRIIGIPKAISEAREIVRAARTNSALKPVEELQFDPIKARKQLPRWAVGMEIARASGTKCIPIANPDVKPPIFLQVGGSRDRLKSATASVLRNLDSLSSDLMEITNRRLEVGADEQNVNAWKDFFKQREEKK